MTNTIGPFPATVHPVRNGVYAVSTPRSSGLNKWAYWNNQFGWSLCSDSLESAASEQLSPNYYGDYSSDYSSMGTEGAVWWGLTKETK